MSRYRKIYVRTWGDDKFRALSAPQPNAQTLWIYLLTGEHTGKMPGLFRAGEASMAESLSWPLKAFREAFEEISSRGMVEADWRARVVFIPNALQHNPPESPNVVKSWASEWDELPECLLKIKAQALMLTFLESYGEGFGEAFRQAIAEDRAKRSRQAIAQAKRQSGALSSDPGSLSSEEPPNPLLEKGGWPNLNSGKNPRARQRNKLSGEENLNHALELAKQNERNGSHQPAETGARELDQTANRPAGHSRVD